MSNFVNFHIYAYVNDLQGKQVIIDDIRVYHVTNNTCFDVGGKNPDFTEFIRDYLCYLECEKREPVKYVHYMIGVERQFVTAYVYKDKRLMFEAQRIARAYDLPYTDTIAKALFDEYIDPYLNPVVIYEDSQD